MLKILIYGYSQKEYSSRQLKKGCNEDVVEKMTMKLQIKNEKKFIESVNG